MTLLSVARSLRDDKKADQSLALAEAPPICSRTRERRGGAGHGAARKRRSRRGEGAIRSRAADRSQERDGTTGAPTPGRALSAEAVGASAWARPLAAKACVARGAGLRPGGRCLRPGGRPSARGRAFGARGRPRLGARPSARGAAFGPAGTAFGPRGGLRPEGRHLVRGGALTSFARRSTPPHARPDARRN